MHPGKQYRLRKDVVAIEVAAKGKHFACTLPKDAEIEIVGGYLTDRRMFDVRWGARPIIMFADDIALHGVEIPAQSDGLARRGPASEERTAQPRRLSAKV